MRRTLAQIAAAALVSFALIALGPARGHPKPFPKWWLKQALCVHSGVKDGQRVGQGEGSWRDPGAPYYGGMQFDLGTWHRNGGGRFARYPHHASPHHQLHVAYVTWKRRGWHPWPDMGRKCGLI